MFLKLNTLPMSGIGVIDVSPTYAPSGVLSLFVSKNGAAFAAAAGTAGYTVIAFTGVAINVNFALGDLDTLGELRWYVLDSGSGLGYFSPTAHQVVAFDPNDAAALGLSDLAAAGDPWAIPLPGAYVAGEAGYIIGNGIDAPISSRSTYAGGPVASVTGGVGGSVAGSVNAVVLPVTAGTVTDKTGYALSGPGVDAIAAAILDAVNGIDTGLTPREAIRLAVAALAGKATVAGLVWTFRDTADTKDRIVATTDGAGQRIAITYDVS
jgi:hypothetical protein